MKNQRPFIKIGLIHENDCNYFSISLSLVRIFFGEHFVVTLKRSEVHTYESFLSVCGGLLGLFLGVSLLSVIEFIYYATLRLFWSIRAKNSVTVFKRSVINNISTVVPNADGIN